CQVHQIPALIEGLTEEPSDLIQAVAGVWNPGYRKNLRRGRTASAEGPRNAERHPSDNQRDAERDKYREPAPERVGESQGIATKNDSRQDARALGGQSRAAETLS